MSEGGPTSPKRPTVRMLVSFSSAVQQWAKRAGRASTKLKPSLLRRGRNGAVTPEEGNSPRLAPRSPFVTRPKQFISQISNKAVTMVQRNKRGEARHVRGHVEDGDDDDDEDEEEEGLWRKGILMGDKCQPLDFSGVICYDSNGKLLDEVPIRSPRATPLPAYLSRCNRNFS